MVCLSLPTLRLAPVVVASYSAHNCFFSAWDLLLALEHGEVAVIYDSITL